MIRIVSIISVLCLLWGSVASANSFLLKDFGVRLYHGNATKPNLWAIELTPPEAHHFNLEAPRSAQVASTPFAIVRQSESSLLFQVNAPAAIAGEKVEVSAFLCDTKKTYCMKKKMQVKLDTSAAKTIEDAFSAQSPFKKDSVKKTEKKTSSKTSDVFIENDGARAIAEAVKTGKPLLIDFYGIWCPPCNLYNETIFNTKAFKAYSEKFVLLKMDADDERSFELKSKLKVGGYPTLVVAKVKSGMDSVGVSDVEELERIVGYYPPKEFYTRLNEAYAHRNDSAEQRWSGRLQKKWEALLEQKKYQELLDSLEVIQASSKTPDTANSKHVGDAFVFRIVAESKLKADFLKSESNLRRVAEVFEVLSTKMKMLGSSAIMHAVDFLGDESLIGNAKFEKAEALKKTAFAMIDELELRVDSKTLYVKDSELTLADLQSMRMGLAETLKDELAVKKFRKQALTAYEKLIHHFASHGNRDLRSLNLEYAYLLWQDGRNDEAKKLYQRFIARFPEEFTFYYAASKMYLELKEFNSAREMAEKALKFSYGDNRIRSMDRLLNVMKAQGQAKEAYTRGTEFLKQFIVPEGLEVRTGRYVDALKKTLKQLNGDQT